MQKVSASARAQLKLAIEDVLDTGLPRIYNRNAPLDAGPYRMFPEKIN